MYPMKYRTYIAGIFLTLLITGTAPPVCSQPGEPVSMVTGQVIDGATGRPVEGISVTLPGYSSTFTDSTGSFTLEIPNSQVVLRISGLEYQTKEVPVKGRSGISVTLFEEGFRSLNDPAYLFYETMPLVYTTGAVSSLDKRGRIWNDPGISAEHTFDDQVPGLRTIARSGTPGIGSNIFMRGFSSVYASNRPLIVVDGFIIETGQRGLPIINGFVSNSLATINPADIENITVVRDATSIYGARGSNGVIYIRTNTPTQMETRIDLSAYGGLNFTPDQIPLLGADDYRRYLSELLQTSGLTPDSIREMPFMIDDISFPDYYRYHNDMNWQNEVFGQSYDRNVNLKVSGGDDVALYALSIGYTRHDGRVKHTDFSRYSFRFNSDINISTRLKMATNLGFTFNQYNLKEDGDAPKTNPVYLSLVKAPFLTSYVRNATGNYSPNLEDEDIFGVSNPTAVIQSLDANSNNYKILGTVDVSYIISDHVTASNLIGVDFDKIRDKIFVPMLGIAPDSLDNGIIENRSSLKVERYLNVFNDFRVTYSRSLHWDHHFAARAGIRVAMNTSEGDWGSDYNSPNDQIRSLGSGVSAFRVVDGYFGDWNWVTLYATGNYNFRNKYFGSLDIAMDGSSRFGEEAGVRMLGGNFGFFPSLSGAWLVSSEPFLAGSAHIDLLKIRASLGMTGNDDIGNYSARKYYASQNFLGSEGLVKGNLWNPDLKWETNLKMNVGLDGSVFNERLTVRVDVFRNRTYDMINFIQANPLSGFETYIDNSGSFITSGAEAELSSRLLSSGVTWDVGGMLSRYRTEVVEFPGNERISTYYDANVLTRVGEPIGLFYGYKTLGVFATQEEADASGLRALMPNTDLVPFSAGDVIFEDVNGDKIIDTHDMQVIGDPNPDFTGMCYSHLSWKGISLDLALSFSVGNQVFNRLRYQLESMKDYSNQTRVVLNRWKGEGQETDIPRAVWGDPIGNSRFSDRWIEDGSYLRLKYISLSYAVPVKAFFLNNLELFISASNLYTLTGYLGMDPEFSLSGESLMQGIDIGMVPQPRSVYAGIKLGL
jgi:TonB-linked SusC/RagA family outer membrane protein